jgi:hypothetical protein
MRTGYHLCKVSDKLSVQHNLFFWHQVWRALRRITIRKEHGFDGTHEGDDLNL